jgi:hypothetical protein
MFEIQKAITIKIPEGEIQKIEDSNKNLIWQKCDYVYTPYDMEKSDAIAVQTLSLSAGDKVTIYYYLTSNSGTLYDLSNCGGGVNSASSFPVNTHGAVTFTVSKKGTMVIAGQYSRYQWGIDWPGSLGMSPPYAQYIKIKVN